MNNIILTNGQCTLVLLCCVLVILTRRIEWIVGIYLGLTSFARAVICGPIALFWILAATIVIGTTLEYLRNSKRRQLITLRDNWIVIWMISWWIFALIFIFLFKPFYSRDYVRYIIMYIILPLPSILIFSQQLKRVKSFAWGFILITILNGLLIFKLSGMLENPSLFLSLTERGLNAQIWIHNYHRIGVAFGISVILLFALFLISKSIILRSMIIPIAILLIVSLFFINSHQMMIACLISITVFFLRVIHKLRKRKLFLICLICAVAFWALIVNSQGVKLIVSNDPVFSPEGLDETWNIRTELWDLGFQAFLKSPIWGDGFHTNAHNLFIGTLSSEGIVGLTFMAGFLFFIGLQSYKLMKRKLRWELTVLTFAFQCIILYGLIHSQYSGGPLSIWHLYWASAFLWVFASLNNNKIVKNIIKSPQ